HDGILHPLFPNRDHPVYHEVANRFVEIEWILEEPVADSYAYLYDQIVAVGELVSTTIVYYYLNDVGLNSKWIDARDYILTDNTHREGLIDWPSTTERIQQGLPSILAHHRVITQGFIGSTTENF